MSRLGNTQEAAEALVRFIDSAPSPWHAVDSAAQYLLAAGFKELDEVEPWKVLPGGRYFVVRDGSSIIAFQVGNQSLADSGFRIIGAHTDSPGFRLKPLPGTDRQGYGMLAVEVYGGPVIASFTDRDLTLSGRVVLREGSGLRTRLVHYSEPLVRFPNVAIHLNREVNEVGLRLHPHDELSLVFSGNAAEPAGTSLRRLLAIQLSVEPELVLTWDLAVTDTQPGQLWGRDKEFIAAARLDNLASCHAAVSSLAEVADREATAVIALFDHEEVGSESFVGAGGAFLRDCLERLLHSQEMSPAQAARARIRSLVISADMAHGTHPNFSRLSDDLHPVRLNGGPVIKYNAKQRYATDSVSAAYFRSLCDRVGVPCQIYSHRNDLPCGSTIGPIVAAGLGIRTIDVGNPMWSMHSARETAGTHDHFSMIRVFSEFLSDGRLPFG